MYYGDWALREHANGHAPVILSKKNKVMKLRRIPRLRDIVLHDKYRLIHSMLT